LERCKSKNDLKSESFRRLSRSSFFLELSG
jgi:hypothetical protein